MVALFLLAAALTASLPRETALRRAREGGPLLSGGLLRQVAGEIADGVRFVARDRALALALLQIYITPTVLLLFGVLGAGYVQRGDPPAPGQPLRAAAPAGVGLILGAWAIGQFGARLRKERLILCGSVGLGCAVAAMGCCRPRWGPCIIGWVCCRRGRTRR